MMIARRVNTAFSFSALVCALGFGTALATGLSLAAFLTAILFILHLAAIWLLVRGSNMSDRLLDRFAIPNFARIGFLISLSILSTSLGLLSWILLFEPGSQVREMLIQLSPVLIWGLVVSIYLLADFGSVLNANEEKKEGFLLGMILFSLVGYLFFFWLSAQLFPFTIDDAYITFRYSKNLANGWGPTYNPGQPTVEGYTTFAWMLLMTLPHFIGVNVATFSKVAGVLLTCGTFGLTSLLTFKLTPTFTTKARLFFSSFAVYLIAMLPITAIHAVSGMETSLFIFLVGLMVYMITAGLLYESNLIFWSPLVALLIGMTRPEGNAISLLLLGCGLVLCDTKRRKSLIWASLLLYILPGALYFLWRAWYYSLTFPLPFYMKVLHGTGLGGVADVRSYLLYLLPPISILVLTALLRFRKNYLLTTIPILFLLLFYLFPVHAMGFEWRFIYPTAFLFSVLAAVGGLLIFDLLRNQIHSRRPWELAFIAGLLLLGLGNLQDLEGMIRNKRAYGAGISSYKTFGNLLSKYDDQYNYRLAIGDAGTLPYYSDWQVIDLFGLNTRELAFGTISVPELVFEEQPVDLIFLSVGNNPNRISDEHAGSQILYDEARSRGMRLLHTFPFGRVNHIWVLGYPESDLASYLEVNQ